MQGMGMLWPEAVGIGEVEFRFDVARYTTGVIEQILQRGIQVLRSVIQIVGRTLTASIGSIGLDNGVVAVSQNDHGLIVRSRENSIWLSNCWVGHLIAQVDGWAEGRRHGFTVGTTPNGVGTGVQTRAAQHQVVLGQDEAAAGEIHGRDGNIFVDFLAVRPGLVVFLLGGTAGAEEE